MAVSLQRTTPISEIQEEASANSSSAIQCFVLAVGKCRLRSSCLQFNLGVNLKLSLCLMVLLCFSSFLQGLEYFVELEPWLYMQKSVAMVMVCRVWPVPLTRRNISKYFYKDWQTSGHHISTTLMNWFPTVSFSEIFSFWGQKISSNNILLSDTKND